MNSIDYPPLYTLQPPNRLRDQQLKKWTQILFENARRSRSNVVTWESPVFINKKIGRKADARLVSEVVHYLCARNLCHESKAGSGRYELQLLSVTEGVKEINRLVFDKGLLDEILDFDDIVEFAKASPLEPMGSGFLEQVLEEMVKAKSVEKYAIDGVDSYKFKLQQ